MRFAGAVFVTVEVREPGARSAPRCAAARALPRQRSESERYETPSPHAAAPIMPCFSPIRMLRMCPCTSASATSRASATSSFGTTDAPDRGGHGARGLRRERVDPLPPPVAVPRTRARLVRADRADEWVPDAHAHRHFRTMGVEAEGNEITGRKLLMWNEDVEISLCCPTEPMDFFYRNGEGDEVIFVHEGSGTLETIFGDLPVQGRRLRRRPARDDLPLRPRGPAAAPRLRVTGPDRDPAPLPERVRAAARARALLPPRHPPADRAAHASRRRRARGEGARQGRLPDVRPRLPPVRRRRLGRLRLPVDVLDPRLRADHGAHPHAAAVAPDLRRAATS